MKNLKPLRIARNLTQGELAGKLGVSRSAVAGWEVGCRYPSSDKLPLLAKVLGCTIDELYKDKKEAV